MTALTVLRGEVHKAVDAAGAEGASSGELAERAAPAQGQHQARRQPDAGQTGSRRRRNQVEFKGSVGADTVTSDVDVSTGGRQHRARRPRLQRGVPRRSSDVQLDPGTVFDLNVYANGLHLRLDRQRRQDGRSTRSAENAEKPSAAKAAERDREQDIWALVHVARYMPDDADWDDYVRQTPSRGLRPASEQADQRERLHDTARRRAKGFE